MKSLKSIVTTLLGIFSFAIFFTSCCSISRIISPNNLPPNCSIPVANFSVSQTIITEGGDVTFRDQSTGSNITSRSWEFQNGTPSSSTDENPVVRYNLPGTYPVILRVSNNNGTDTEIRSEYITVLKKLNANFTAAPRIVKSGETVSFTDNSEGDNIVNRVWTFEGGSPGTSNETSPKVRYNTPGSYQVKLEIRNSLNETDVEIKTGFIIVEDKTEIIIFEPSPITRECPSHVDGDKEFDGHGPDVQAWAQLRIEENKKIYVDYFLQARETQDDWTTARGRWSKLLWTAGTGQYIVRINSDMRSETSYTDTDHVLDHPSIFGGNLVNKFEIMGDTGGNDVSNCTRDDVYISIYFNPIKVLVRNE